MKHEVSCEFAGRQLTMEVGRLARQADAAVLARYGDTVMLVTACVSDKPKDLPFLPLRVDFEEKMYSVGRIPGGFFKREGKPSDEATVMARAIDRPIRPLLPENLRNDVQVIVNPLSVATEGSVALVAGIAASAALHLSQIPFDGPFAMVQIGREIGDDELIVNPNHEILEEGELDLLAAISQQGIVQIEAEADEVSEQTVWESLRLAHDSAQPVLEAIEALRDAAGKPKADFPLWEPDQQIVELIHESFADRVRDTLHIGDKLERNRALGAIKDEIIDQLPEELQGNSQDLEYVVEDIQKTYMQKVVMEENRRVDGRGFDEIRDVETEVGFLPRAHGSGLFTRGDTQVLTTTTLGARRDQRAIRTLEEEEEFERFTHHYNFLPFSVGEVKALRAPSRREVGHGFLAGNALKAILPDEEDFPYTVRCVSEVLGGDASTSMASACASSLALMDAGVPISAPVAGIACGLVQRSPDDYQVFVDMQAIEDFFGHMDFKVAGTRDGITAMQVDTKLAASSLDVCADALRMAKEARLEILEAMEKTIQAPREELCKYAPRMYTFQIPEDHIGTVIGPGGSTVRNLQEDYDVQIDIEDDGMVFIFGEDAEGAEQARETIQQMTREVEVGEIIKGEVTSTTAFGAFVEVAPGRDGLLHISELAKGHVDKTEDVVKKGDEVEVKVIEVADDGKIRLSRKALLSGSQKGGSSRRSSERSSKSRKKTSRSSEKRSSKSEKRSKESEKRSKEPETASDSSSGSDQVAEEISDFETGRGKAYFRDKK